MNPTKEFRDYMISQGAALVGIGDLTAVPSSDYPVGIAVYYFERQTECHCNCR